LIEARNLGWNTLLADDKDEWIKNVNHQLLTIGHISERAFGK
jgi:putative hydrolase of the HAD superfamily